MFTGLISDVGEIIAVEVLSAGKRFEISCSYHADTIPMGASIACDGACMTVISLDKKDSQTLFKIEVSPESLEKTTLANWQVGDKINLERSLRLGDELGGHIVTGHVDGMAHITEILEEGDFRLFWFEAPEELAKFVAEKGSVALNGTSLTVNKVRNNLFSLQMIPHTLACTNWNRANPGDSVNMEVDLMARYAARLLDARVAK